jgi:hypothetical protein
LYEGNNRSQQEHTAVIHLQIVYQLLNDDVLALNVAKLAHGLPKRLDEFFCRSASAEKLKVKAS